MSTSDLNGLPSVIREAVWQLVLACQRELSPLPARCDHATEAPACCPDCAVIRTAEAILADGQPTEAPSGGTGVPRSPLEQAVLEALQALAPLPATTLQVACLVDTASYREVRTVLQALVMLGAIEHPRKGYYRYRPGR